MTANRRAIVRHTTNADACIITVSGQTLSCTIKDRSESGAQLCVDEALELPKEFMLQMVGAPEQMRARVVWRSAGNLGVEIDH
jgi:hypothetical protein